MTKIHSIVCCCGQGLGSSMIVEMNVRNVLLAMGITNVSVTHIPLSEASKYKGDLYICGLDVAYQLCDYPRVIVLRNLIMMEELDKKLREAFQSEKEEFYIE